MLARQVKRFQGLKLFVEDKAERETERIKNDTQADSMEGKSAEISIFPHSWMLRVSVFLIKIHTQLCEKKTDDLSES
jgi:hypothetical protein